MNNIIFHLPFFVNADIVSASNIRPIKMLQAFKDMGYNVFVIDGYIDNRKKKIKELKKELKNGKQFDFCYSESSTMPTALTQTHHMPIAPYLDYKLFKLLKASNISIGLFYRDIHWKFPLYKKNTNQLKRTLAIFFYKLDLKKYKKYLDVLFLPSKEMNHYVPFNFTNVQALPPAAELWEKVETANIKLRIVYVGGLSDAIYNKSDLFKACALLQDKVELIVCTRKTDWANITEEVRELCAVDNISIVHLNGDKAIELIKSADICSLLMGSNPYNNFAISFKIFEYLSYNKPIIATKNSAAGNLVEQNKLGWVVESNPNEIKNILEEIILDKNAKIESVNKNIKPFMDNNTWRKRTEFVKSQLISK